MKRASLALCSLVAVLTLPAYAENRPTAPNAPSASGAAPAPSSAPAPSARPGVEHPLVAEVLILHATNEQKGIDSRIGPLPELGKEPAAPQTSYAASALAGGAGTRCRAPVRQHQSTERQRVLATLGSESARRPSLHRRRPEPQKGHLGAGDSGREVALRLAAAWRQETRDDHGQR